MDYVAERILFVWFQILRILTNDMFAMYGFKREYQVGYLDCHNNVTQRQTKDFWMLYGFRTRSTLFTILFSCSVVRDWQWVDVSFCPSIYFFCGFASLVESLFTHNLTVLTQLHAPSSGDGGSRRKEDVTSLPDYKANFVFGWTAVSTKTLTSETLLTIVSYIIVVLEFRWPLLALRVQ